MNPGFSLLERIAALALPRNERELILADLWEESTAAPGRGAAWRGFEAMRIGGRFHAECYRDADARLRIGFLLLVASGLIGVIHVAGAGWAPGGRAFFTDPLGRAVVDFWSATHLTSAIAAGLVVGRFSLVPQHATHSRWHVALACGAGLLMMHGFRAGSLAALLLFASTWLGDRGRPAADDDTTPAHG